MKLLLMFELSNQNTLNQNQATKIMLKSKTKENFMKKMNEPI